MLLYLLLAGSPVAEPDTHPIIGYGLAYIKGFWVDVMTAQ